MAGSTEQAPAGGGGSALAQVLLGPPLGTGTMCQALLRVSSKKAQNEKGVVWAIPYLGLAIYSES